MNEKIKKQLKKTQSASHALGLLSHADRNKILKSLATNLKQNKKKIISANEKDLKIFDESNPGSPMRDRLMLNDARIESMAHEIEDIISSPDPIGELFDCRERNGLKICRQRVPIGVIGIIYESRPNVTTDATAIAIKAGNGAVLKGGKEARFTYTVLSALIKRALLENGIDTNVVVVVDPIMKDAVSTIISATGLVDVVIPRGGQGLINFVRDNATVPVIETGAGVCHTFVDESAKLIPSAKMVFNAKTQRPSVCNALDTLLVHKKIAGTFLPISAKMLATKEVEIFADLESFAILKKCYPAKLLKHAKPADFGREFLSQKMSVRIVSNLKEATAHISKYSSKHSEAILTENRKNAQQFQNEVDAAAVYVNASTRFSDGAVFGLGSEIGISTSKLHARGPMGPREMTTYKWVITGKYACRI